MKYSIKNPFNPKLNKVELSENEIEYISMLAAGVDKKNAAEILSMTYYKQRKLYDKLGLTEKRRKHHIQAVYLFSINNIIKDEIFSQLYKKYKLIECKEMIECNKKQVK